MEKLLSQEEIDALLSAVAEGRIDPDHELARQRGGVVTYDLFNSSANAGIVPNLDIVYDGFIRYYRVTISNRLRRIVEIRKRKTRSYKFDDFLKTLPSPACMGIFRMDPLKGAAMVALDSNMVFATVDSVLGGTGSIHIAEQTRPFTSIELRLMQKIVNDALVDLEKAWSPLLAAKMNLVRMEMNPRLVNIVPPEYQVLTTELEIQIDEIKGSMIFAVPYMTIETVRDKLKNGAQFDIMAIDPKWSQRLSSELVEVPMELAVEMGRATITLRDLVSLQRGDTIVLDRNVCDELQISVGGIGKFKGVPGTRRGNNAVMITRNKGEEAE